MWLRLHKLGKPVLVNTDNVTYIWQFGKLDYTSIEFNFATNTSSTEEKLCAEHMTVDESLDEIAMMINEDELLEPDYLI